MYFSATAMKRLFEGGVYLKAPFNFVTGKTGIYSRVISYVVPLHVSFQ